MRSVFCPSWDVLSRLWAVLGCLKSTLGGLWVVFGRLGLTFWRLRTVLDIVGSTFGRLWSTFWALWAALRRLLGCPEGSLGRLGRPWAAMSEKSQSAIVLPIFDSILMICLEGLEGLRTTCRHKVTKKTSSAGT